MCTTLEGGRGVYNTRGGGVYNTRGRGGGVQHKGGHAERNGEV